MVYPTLALPQCATKETQYMQRGKIVMMEALDQVASVVKATISYSLKTWDGLVRASLLYKGMQLFPARYDLREKPCCPLLAQPQVSGIPALCLLKAEVCKVVLFVTNFKLHSLTTN